MIAFHMVNVSSIRCKCNNSFLMTVCYYTLRISYLFYIRKVIAQLKPREMIGLHTCLCTESIHNTENKESPEVSYFNHL